MDDLNDDSYLDLVLAHENNPFDLLSLEAKEGLYVKIIPTNIRLHKDISWGSYMGSRYDGIYHVSDTPGHYAEKTLF